MQVLLKVGGFDWIGYTSGQRAFIKCPVNQCLLTNDIMKKESADALLITQMNKASAKRYLPKPEHQIWIVKHHVSFQLLENTPFCVLSKAYIDASANMPAYLLSCSDWNLCCRSTVTTVPSLAGDLAPTWMDANYHDITNNTVHQFMGQ